MRILGLDTTGPHCSVALVDTAKVLAYKSEKIGRGHAERLAPMVQEVLAEAGLSAKDVDKLAVCTGPGSFTGLRVALAFAKGFALPRKLPVVGLPSLAIWAAQTDPEAQKKLVSIGAGMPYLTARSSKNQLRKRVKRRIAQLKIWVPK